MTTIDRLLELRAKRVTHAAELAALDAEIANLVRQALKEGCGPTRLAEILDVSRNRIYQIVGPR